MQDGEEFSQVKGRMRRLKGPPVQRACGLSSTSKERLGQAEMGEARSGAGRPYIGFILHPQCKESFMAV